MYKKLVIKYLVFFLLYKESKEGSVLKSIEEYWKIGWGVILVI